MSYVVGEKPAANSCIFCDLPDRGTPRDDLVLSADEHVVVMMNRYPYNNGHIMVAPRAHTADMDLIEGPAYAALNETVRRAASVLRDALTPDGMNIGLNLGRTAGAGIDSHLHWHLVPRWDGDTNFMPVIGETKVMPQHLSESFDLLAPYFR